MPLTTILLIVVIIIILGGIGGPFLGAPWRNGGYGGIGLGGLLVVILLIYLLFGGGFR
jgi:Protein of unknown function (DUF3309)